MQETEVLNQLVKQVGDSGYSRPANSLTGAGTQANPLPCPAPSQELPGYEILSIALGVGGAFMLGIPNALVVGIVSGLAAGKGYDWAKGTTETPK